MAGDDAGSLPRGHSTVARNALPPSQKMTGKKPRGTPRSLHPGAAHAWRSSASTARVANLSDSSHACSQAAAGNCIVFAQHRKQVLAGARLRCHCAASQLRLCNSMEPVKVNTTIRRRQEEVFTQRQGVADQMSPCSSCIEHSPLPLLSLDFTSSAGSRDRCLSQALAAYLNRDPSPVSAHIRAERKHLFEHCILYASPLRSCSILRGLSLLLMFGRIGSSWAPAPPAPYTSCAKANALPATLYCMAFVMERVRRYRQMKLQAL